MIKGRQAQAELAGANAGSDLPARPVLGRGVRPAAGLGGGRAGGRKAGEEAGLGHVLQRENTGLVPVGGSGDGFDRASARGEVRDDHGAVRGGGGARGVCAVGSIVARAGEPSGGGHRGRDTLPRDGDLAAASGGGDCAAADASGHASTVGLGGYRAVCEEKEAVGAGQ